MKSSNEFTIIYRAIRALELRGLLHCFDILLCRVPQKVLFDKSIMLLAHNCLGEYMDGVFT